MKWDRIVSDCELGKDLRPNQSIISDTYDILLTGKNSSEYI